MTATLVRLWRHPIKSHGREALTETALTENRPLPWDRHWAVLHDSAQASGDGWAPYQNFMVGTRTPGLAGLWAELDEDAGRVALRHAALGDFRLAPDDPEDAQRFFNWLSPILPENRARPRAIVRAPDRGMTDTDYPSVSVMNMASHRAVAQRLGRTLEPERWRGNIWLDGLAPWEEFDLIGRDLRVGGAVLRIVEPVERCLHTAASPVTGQRDADTLDALDSWGHRNFGVYAQVVSGGRIACGDTAEPA